MRRTLALFAVMLLAGSAFALPDDGENSLGCYFDDPTFDLNCADPVTGAPWNFYFVLANPTQPSIGGFEFAWALDPAPATPPLILAPTFPGPGLDVDDTDYGFVVGLSSPVLTTEATVLVLQPMLFLAAPAELTYITIGPVGTPSIPGSTVYADGENPGLLIPMDYSTVDGTEVVVDENGWVDPGVGSIYCPSPIATENSTWGSVKSLYE